MTLLEFVDKNAAGLAIFSVFVLLFFVLPALAIIAETISERKK